MKHILDLPWGLKDVLKEKYGMKIIKGGFFLYSGVLLPKELRPFRVLDFSLGRWNEDEANAHVSTPERDKSVHQLTEEQQKLSDTIFRNYSDNKPGTAIWGQPGSGKKTAILDGLLQIVKNSNDTTADENNKPKLLIVTDKSSISLWRKTMKKSSAACTMMRTMIIDYGSMSKILRTPPSARITQKKSTKTRMTAKKGESVINWDYIIFDESALLYKYPQNLLSHSAIALAKLHKPYIFEKSPYTIFISKQEPVSPLDVTLMSQLFAPQLEKYNPTEKITPDNWLNLLQDNNFSVSSNTRGWVWLAANKKQTSENLMYQAKDMPRFKKLINHAESPAIVVKNSLLSASDRECYVPYPIELKGAHKVSYGLSWDDFKNWMNRNLMGKDTTGYAFNYLHHINKTTELKTDYILTLLLDLVISGQQIIVQTTSTTQAQNLHEKLLQKKVPAVILEPDTDPLKNWGRFELHKTQILVADREMLSKLPSTSTSKTPLFVLSDYSVLPSFQKIIPQLYPYHRKTIVYVPYLDQTVEETIIDKAFYQTKYNPNFSFENIEKFYRTAAAKTTPPNRMS